MNKKTFVVALLFLGLTLLWLGLNVYWLLTRTKCVSCFDLFIGAVFVIAAAGMVYNELKKHRRRHLQDVVKNKIP